MDLLSTTRMSEILTGNGTPTRPSTLRTLHRLGAYLAHRTSRGELQYTDDDVKPLSDLIKKRRANRHAAMWRGRMAAIKAARAARR
jgi:hypothetical protein